MPGQPEPCTSCGENTAIGTPFYSDRRVLDPTGPNRRFICALCVQNVTQKRRRRRPMSEEERRELERSAAAFGGFAPGGH